MVSMVLAEEECSLLSSAVVNRGTEEEITITGYRRSWIRTIVSSMLTVLLAGLPYLVGRWKPKWKLVCTSYHCALKIAQRILIVDKETLAVFVEEICEEDVDSEFQNTYTIEGEKNATPNDSSRLLNEKPDTFRYFLFRHLRYVWNEEDQFFFKLKGYDNDTLVSKFFDDLYNGIPVRNVSSQQQLYGPNFITINVPSYFSLLVEEVLHPFYIFQLCSIVLWSLDQYVFYAVCIFLISLLSVLISLYETRRQSESLHDMVSQGSGGTSEIVRPDQTTHTVENSGLVPGDVILVPPHGCVMCCDAVLVTGSAIVNESMLTGESVPVTKSCLSKLDIEDDEVYSTEVHKRHTLFAGTAVIQTRYYGEKAVLAVVVRTGFCTSKGELIRSILFPKPMDFKFYKDSIRFIGVLFCVALVGMSYCVYLYVKRGSDLSMILLRTLDVITIVVPPALPAAMTVGTVYAQSRLRRQGIFCISPPRINVCGKLKVICFDKTGTLTEDGLDMWGVLPTEGQHFKRPVKDITELERDSLLLANMTTCHSLIVIDGNINGDPLDIKMFESTKWELEEGGEDNEKYDKMISTIVKPPQLNSEPFSIDDLPLEIGITRQFTFSSTLARMSVIVRKLGKRNFTVFTKGAPEKIEELCVEESIPEDFHLRLQELTVSGYRVIALAAKQLDNKVNWVAIQKMKRGDVESELHFLGFLVMQNTLKPESAGVIAELKAASLRCVMVTGDNLLTALSVARDCGMVGRGDRVVIAEAEPKGGRMRLKFDDAEKINNTGNEACVLDMDPECHVAITGKTWTIIKEHFPELLHRILLRGTIFSRMSPDQKANLVEELQTLGYIVSMCGDGANDCGALKAAHVGVSLSEAEASVAAPFTSSIPNISCIPKLIKEGRCALTTSFGVFKYMALYSMIQFISVLILYSNKTNLGDTQFLYIDLVITTTVAVLMGRTGPWETLVSQRPPGSLVSGQTLMSVAVQILACLAGQLGAIFFLQSRAWYVPVDPPNPEDEIIVNSATTVIFIVSSYQYLSLATVFSKGAPYRKPFYTNFLYFAALVCLTSFTAILFLNPVPAFGKFFQLKIPAWSFRLSILLIVFLNTSTNFLLECILSHGTWVKQLSHLISRKKQPKNKYKLVRKEMDLLSETWPQNEATYLSQGYS
eukprot:GFUD01008222.1.p1 GENE.GFUD01008222.1~~GFUD01008222.1.p1  ORF type:complete len:1156 (+),score=221.75 GFUD01008222.1:90-3557(+)